MLSIVTSSQLMPSGTVDQQITSRKLNTTTRFNLYSRICETGGRNFLMKRKKLSSLKLTQSSWSKLVMKSHALKKSPLLTLSWSREQEIGKMLPTTVLRSMVISPQFTIHMRTSRSWIWSLHSISIKLFGLDSMMLSSENKTLPGLTKPALLTTQTGNKTNQTIWGTKAALKCTFLERGTT